jgi:site-specific DNA-cytosine methylase
MPYGPPGSGKTPFITPRQAIAECGIDSDIAENSISTGGPSSAKYPIWDPDVCGSLGTMTTKGFMKSGQRMGHWDGHRDFTIPEYCVLSGFPRHYQFKGTRTEALKQMGNAVPPVFWTHFISPIAQWISDWKDGKFMA